MTTLAGHVAMLAQQFEVSVRVVKRIFVQCDDIGIAALVIAMTTLAGGSVYRG